MVLSLVTVGAVVKLSQMFVQFQIARDMNNSAVLSLEKMIREIKSAESVDITGSTLGTSPGRLVLDTEDEFGLPLEVQFFVSSSSLHFMRGGVDLGPVTSNTIQVDSLVFIRLTSSNSEAVTIEMVLTAQVGANTQTKNYKTTVIVHGSY